MTAREGEGDVPSPSSELLLERGQRPQQSKTTLAAEEREVIVTYNDAEKIWRVYSDSATLRGTLLRLAQRIGAEVHHVGDHGLEFRCPVGALRLTARRRPRPSKAFLRNLRRGLQRPDNVGPPGGKVTVLATAQESSEEPRP